MKSNLAQMIEESVEECFTYGRGLAYDTAQKIKIVAEWAENEEDIEITVFENRIIRFTYTEKGMIEK